MGMRERGFNVPVIGTASSITTFYYVIQSTQPYKLIVYVTGTCFNFFYKVAAYIWDPRWLKMCVVIGNMYIY